MQPMVTRSLARQRQHHVVRIQHVARGSLSSSALPSRQVSTLHARRVIILTRSKAYLEIPEPERGAYDGLRLRRSAQGFLRVKATPFQNHVIRPEQAYVACVNAVAAFFHETR